MQHIIAKKDFSANFGTVEIQVNPSAPIDNKDFYFIFNIDVSGSMCYRCKDERTKLQQVQHVLKNMITMFSKFNSVSISIQTFNHTVTPILSKTRLTPETDLVPILQKLENMYPDGSTNVECALQQACQMADTCAEEGEYLVHLFLTDGEINEGSANVSYLRSLVSDKMEKQVFLGFGTEHNCMLLNSLLRANDEYRFIDSFERTGMVCGEILFSIMNISFYSLVVGGDGFEVYDFVKNEWVSKMEVGDLYRGQSKTLHFRKIGDAPGQQEQKPSDVPVQQEDDDEKFLFVHYKTKEGNYHWKYISSQDFQSDDLRVYLLRQETLEMLFEARALNDKLNRTKEELNNMKDSLLKLSNKIKEFQITNNHSLLEMLRCDIEIVSNKLGTNEGAMFICSRQYSNGKEQAYVCSLEEPMFSPHGTEEMKQMMETLSS